MWLKGLLTTCLVLALSPRLSHLGGAFIPSPPNRRLPCRNPDSRSGCGSSTIRRCVWINCSFRFSLSDRPENERNSHVLTPAIFGPSLYVIQPGLSRRDQVYIGVGESAEFLAWHAIWGLQSRDTCQQQFLSTWRRNSSWLIETYQR